MPETQSKRVLLVGQCGVDGPRLQEEFSSRFPGVEVLRVNSEDDLERECESGADLVLVNREPVGFDDDGIELVRRLCGTRAGHKVMLVSDLPEAQREAEEIGAVPGFGKSEIGRDSLAETVRKALAS